MKYDKWTQLNIQSPWEEVLIDYGTLNSSSSIPKSLQWAHPFYSTNTSNVFFLDGWQLHTLTYLYYTHGNICGYYPLKCKALKMYTSPVQSQQKVSQYYSQNRILSIKDKWSGFATLESGGKTKGNTSMEVLGATPGKSHLPLPWALAWIEGTFAVASPNLSTEPKVSLGSSNSTKTSFQRPFYPHHPALSNCLKLAL